MSALGRSSSRTVRVPGEAGLLTQLFRDAVELTRAARMSAARARSVPEPSLREVLREVLASDGYKVLAAFRLRQVARRRHVPGVNHLLRLASTAIFGIEVDSGVLLGDGVLFVHTLGTVVGGGAVVGKRVRFMGNNTLGTAREDGWPVLGDDVVVGAGARILGPVRIGAGAVIGANAVVVDDVAPGEVVAGIPARPLPRRPAVVEEVHP